MCFTDELICKAEIATNAINRHMGTRGREVGCTGRLKLTYTPDYR